MSDSLNSPGEALNLPEPQSESVPYKVESANVDDIISELGGAKSVEHGSSITQPIITQPTNQLNIATPFDLTADSTPIDTPMTPIANAPTTPVSSTPTMADDNDLIEKEWVERAKRIVESTKADPRVQNQEIGRYKAEYIKKRFNKDIKTATDSAEG
ncbi:MAG TPA: hypothetical protein VLF39_03320 [Candidatus Saccharimonadales bacterium]|nr:hypothetical protein [Candidatus Saccharimonadales bacterium]